MSVAGTTHHLLPILHPAFLSFFFSTFCAALISKFGPGIALIDNPNGRSSHSLPTPRGGRDRDMDCFFGSRGFHYKRYIFYINCRDCRVDWFPGGSLYPLIQAALVHPVYHLCPGSLAIFNDAALYFSSGALRILGCLYSRDN